MNGSNCDICHRDVTGTDHLRHKITRYRICPECQAKLTLHSPNDFLRIKHELRDGKPTICPTPRP